MKAVYEDIHLKPAEFLKEVNSCGYTYDLTMRRLRSHIRKAGTKISKKTGHVSAFKYLCWLLDEYSDYETKAAQYQRHVDRVKARADAAQRAASEIGELPPVVNKRRKRVCRLDLGRFCKEYFPDVFTLPWSDDHLKVIHKIEQAVLTGGLFALAMPRGTGKTVITKTAVVWAALYGHSLFSCYIAGSSEKAKDGLDGIKTWIETNPLLSEDFPEVCYPVKKLERIATRQRAQRYLGEFTRIDWTSDHLVFPTIEGSVSSGCVITSSGMKGSEIRGQQFTTVDGRVLRPRLALVDDPQTTDSAWSNSQCERRFQVVTGDILGMAGPGQKISGLITCTVIRSGDLADMLLDREKNPDWKGERCKLMYAFPKNEKLWDEYNRIRVADLRNDGTGKQATEFYIKNRKAMDEGAVPAWKDRYNEDEASAIQHAMNLRFRNEAAFFAEYQNEPAQEDTENDSLTESEIMDKVNGTPRGVVPEHCHFLTCFIDIQKDAFFWMVCAWEEDFTGYIIDYGCFPEQKRTRFTLRTLSPTLSERYPGTGLEGWLYAGLEELTKELLTRTFPGVIRGSEYKISQLIIDANWGESTDVVYQFCRQSKLAQLMIPSHGKYIGAGSIPFSEYRKTKGDVFGFHYLIPSLRGKRAIRHVLIDTNYWKSFVHARLAAPMGDKGCLSLFGHDPTEHIMLADQLSSEYFVPVTAKERTVNEWKLRPGKRDNHWLDCLVGCAVGASMLGSRMKVVVDPRAFSMPRKAVRFSELQQARREEVASERGGAVRFSDLQKRVNQTI
jgi:hypothetical protein